MLATTQDAKQNVRNVVRWLKRRFNYEANDLPTGLNGRAYSCPIACAIKSVQPKGVHVSVGVWVVEINGKMMVNNAIPESVKHFIRNFDARVYGWTDYEGEGC